jgi:hypothetical protein
MVFRTLPKGCSFGGEDHPQDKILVFCDCSPRVCFPEEIHILGGSFVFVCNQHGRNSISQGTVLLLLVGWGE